MASEPFRLFFPLGTLCAVVGALYWPGLFLEIIFKGHASRLHIFLMIYGFMWGFIVGFLGTAVPRLTKSKTLSVLELAALLCFYLLTLGAIFWQHYSLAPAFFLLNLFGLLIMLARRILAQRPKLPPTFIYVPFGLLSAASASALSIASSLGWLALSESVLLWTRSLLFQGLILFLLLGIGGFLIRSILGWAAPLPETAQAELPKFQGGRIGAVHAGVALLLFVSFWVEPFYPQLSLVVRALLATLVVALQMKAYRRPISGKLTAGTLQIAMGLLLLGLWGQVFAPQAYRVAVLHVTFMGGFAISVFAVATRVILSHCGYSELLKGRYRPFTWAMILLIVGLATRFSANLMPDTFFSHLAYAGIIWIAGVLLWSGAILSKSIRTTCAVLK
jgi:uncharacterized protein involved in response to NO